MSDLCKKTFEEQKDKFLEGCSSVEELGELAAAVTKNKPIEDVAEEMADVLILLMGHSLAMNIDLRASFEAKVDKIMQRPARKGRLGIRVTEYTDS